MPKKNCPGQPGATATEPVKPADDGALRPEFARTPQVDRLFGIKRGTLYNMHADGLVTGVVLRVRGAKSGVRLWNVDSIRQAILKSSARSLPFGAGGVQ